MESVGAEEASKVSKEELFKVLLSSDQGLSSDEALKRLETFGKNAIVDKRENPYLKFFSYFWGPIPWMIEVAAALSLVLQRWPDFVIISILLVFNAFVGFWEEFQAGNAIEALKKKLASRSRVLRDGKWCDLPASDLVPGDVIRVRLGDIIPADAKLIEGEYLTVDQSALTGESLPVNKKCGEVLYSGSVAKQGEMVALVTATGSATYFGKTAKLVSQAASTSHFQQAVVQIGHYLIYMCLGLVSVLILVQLERGDPILELLQFALILTIASIPVAMPAVLSVTMAVGALALSKMKAIVSRLDSIEEMAGVDILCSDKTGTLTQNVLKLGEPVLFGKASKEEVILYGALASKEEDQDPIDLAVMEGVSVESYKQTKFVPFDPVSKRTEATLEREGKTIYCTKGAPQVVLGMSQVSDEVLKQAKKAIEELASRGYRTLGVAKSTDYKTWEFLGLLPLSDPLRVDSKETIEQAEAHGIDVKMVTGDNIAIAKEISSQLGLGENIFEADTLFGKEQMVADTGEKVEKASGFAQVFPEHKYGIVKALQERGHITGMTGDGVNDSPALKQADVGIAVSGATDAARAAASLVLTSPGLSVIISAIEEARKIFERMNSYAIYRIVETLRIMFFVVLTMLVYNFYPINALMIILLALLNDFPIMTIAYDNTWLDPNPVRWNMRRVLTVATILGLIGVVETFLLLVIAKSFMGISGEQLQSVIFLKLVVAGHLTLFVARSRRPFFMRPFPSPILLGAVLVTQAVAAMIVGFGIGVAAIPWAYVGYIWAYCLFWIFIEDGAKLLVYKHIKASSS
jgi:H+-transporting ATPase